MMFTPTNLDESKTAAYPIINNAYAPTPKVPVPAISQSSRTRSYWLVQVPRPAVGQCRLACVERSAGRPTSAGRAWLCRGLNRRQG